MSKIGRKPIDLGNVNVEIDGREVRFQGAKAMGVHVVPEELAVEIHDKTLKLVPAGVKTAQTNLVWGLHRALLANKIKGAQTGFDKQLRIVGLGYKAAVAGSKLQFNLGYSHKIDFELPQGVTVEIDKSGQLMTFKSSDKMLLGAVCSKVRALRLPEPYKGTGIQYVNEVIRRKAGKAKS